MARDVYIPTQGESKGRTFRAMCLATVTADTLWEGGAVTDHMRPVWAMFAGSEAQLKPFAINVLSGRKAHFVKGHGYTPRNEEKLDMLRSAGYQSAWQREAEGSVVTMFLPDLFAADPGMVDPKGATFIVMPPAAWQDEQKIDAGSIVRHVYKLLPEGLRKGDEAISKEDLAALIPMAFLFCTYLDRRTRCPLVADGRFFLQLLISCLGDGLAAWPGGDQHAYHRERFGLHGKRFRGFQAKGLEDVGLGRPIAFQATHEEIEAKLARQVEVFFEATKGR